MKTKEGSWSIEEQKKLLELRNRGLSNTKISEILGRDYRSISNKLHNIKHKSITLPNLYRNWSKEEDLILVKYQDNLKYATTLLNNRTRASVCQRMYKIKKDLSYYNELKSNLPYQNFFIQETGFHSKNENIKKLVETKNNNINQYKTSDIEISSNKELILINTKGKYFIGVEIPHI